MRQSLFVIEHLRQVLCLPKTPSGVRLRANRRIVAWSCPMLRMVALALGWMASLAKSRRRLQAENLVLRHQLNILRRQAPGRVRMSNAERLAFAWLYRLYPTVADAVAIIRPETVIRWHRRGFRALWRWKTRSRGGRPQIPREIRDLIREVSRANGLWGAPRIHGELLKLGIKVAQSIVAKYMVKRPGQPGQSWTTFLRNHAAGIAAADMFVVPTIGFKLLYCMVFLAHGRRELVHHAVTAHPTAEWVARQMTEALPVGHSAKISGARSRRRLWPRREAAPACAGYSGSTNGTEVALAKRLRGAFDQLDTTRVP
jgi:hypothetical protein